jgi:hypothetical protein
LSSPSDRPFVDRVTNAEDHSAGCKAFRVHGRLKADVDCEATAGSGACGDGRVVDVGDALDDREAQPDTVSAASGLRGESLEGLKEARELVGRDEPAGVGDGENRMFSLGTGCDFDSAAGDIVTDRVGECERQ